VSAGSSLRDERDAPPGVPARIGSLLRGTVGGVARGVGAAVAIGGTGVALNVGAFLLLVYRAGRTDSGLGWVETSLFVPVAFAVAALFTLAHLVIAQRSAHLLVLRSWYDTYRAQVVVAVEAVVRESVERAPAGGQRLAGASSAPLAGGLRSLPAPLRVVTGWALKRAGYGRLLGLLDEPGKGFPARLDAFIRDELLAVGLGPYRVLLLVNLAVAAAALLWIG
jgi:hypothetical protein